MMPSPMFTTHPRSAPRWGWALTFVIAAVLACSCGNTVRSVVVYTSVDQVYSEPVLREFGRRTGVRVLPVYDVEAVKTTGLVNRLMAEKERPIADVFWSGEFAQTLLLKERGVLAPYLSPKARGRAPEWADPSGYWTCFGGRARVLLLNTRLAGNRQPPLELLRLADGPLPPNQIAVANPLFGTSFTQAAALYAALGPVRARAFYAGLLARGVRVAEGNADVRAMVESGQVLLGLLDSDDACASIRSGAPVKALLPDQMGAGTLVIPNSVALIAGAPRPHEGKALIDYLLSSPVEQRLTDAGWVQVSARGPVSPDCLNAGPVKASNMSPVAVYAQMQQARKDLGDLFLK